MSDGPRSSAFGKLVLTDLPSGISSEVVRCYFSRYGEVVDVHISRAEDQRPWTGMVRFATAEPLDVVVQQPQHVIDGSQVGVEAVSTSEEGCRVYVVCSKFCSEACLRDVFREHGTVVACKVLRDRRHQSRGCAYVTFSEPAGAERAIATVNGMDLRGRTLKVLLSDERRPTDASPHASPVAGAAVPAGQPPPTTLPPLASQCAGCTGDVPAAVAAVPPPAPTPPPPCTASGAGPSAAAGTAGTPAPAAFGAAASAAAGGSGGVAPGAYLCGAHQLPPAAGIVMPLAAMGACAAAPPSAARGLAECGGHCAHPAPCMPMAPGLGGSAGVSQQDFRSDGIRASTSTRASGQRARAQGRARNHGREQQVRLSHGLQPPPPPPGHGHMGAPVMPMAGAGYMAGMCAAPHMPPAGVHAPGGGWQLLAGQLQPVSHMAAYGAVPGGPPVVGCGGYLAHYAPMHAVLPVPGPPHAAEAAAAASVGASELARARAAEARAGPGGAASAHVAAAIAAAAAAAAMGNASAAAAPCAPSAGQHAAGASSAGDGAGGTAAGAPAATVHSGALRALPATLPEGVQLPHNFAAHSQVNRAAQTLSAAAAQVQQYSALLESTRAIFSAVRPELMAAVPDALDESPADSRALLDDLRRGRDGLRIIHAESARKLAKIRTELTQVDAELQLSAMMHRPSSPQRSPADGGEGGGGAARAQAQASSAQATPAERSEPEAGGSACGARGSDRDTVADDDVAIERSMAQLRAMLSQQVHAISEALARAEAHEQQMSGAAAGADDGGGGGDGGGRGGGSAGPEGSNGLSAPADGAHATGEKKPSTAVDREHSATPPAEPEHAAASAAAERDDGMETTAAAGRAIPRAGRGSIDMIDGASRLKNASSASSAELRNFFLTQARRQLSEVPIMCPPTDAGLEDGARSGEAGGGIAAMTQQVARPWPLQTAFLYSPPLAPTPAGVASDMMHIEALAL